MKERPSGTSLLCYNIVLYPRWIGRSVQAVFFGKEESAAACGGELPEYVPIYIEETHAATESGKVRTGRKRTETMEKDKNSQLQYRKMTGTPVHRLILQLSAPSIISMLITNIYNLVDTAFVGQLGNSASGAVGIVFGFMSIIQAFAFMFGQGAGSAISRALGGRDTERASVYASSGFAGSFVCGAVITGIGFAVLGPMVMALGSTETIAPFARTYITYILIAAPFMSSSLTMNNILRYEGRAALGMIGLMTGAILNMIGDPIFMFGMGMGIAGAGLSTALSQIISFGILLSMFLTGRSQSRLSLKRAASGFGVYLDIMATGFPSLLRQGLNSITTVLLNTHAAVYGDAAVAAMSIVSRIVFFVFSIAIGIGQGFQPVSGFNYGAGRYSRLRKGYRFTMLLAEGILAAAVVLVFLKSGSLIGIFRDDPEVIRIGTRALRLQCAALFLLPPCMVTEMLFQSTGRRLQASVLSALRSGIFFIPSLLILDRFRGLAGIQEAQPLAYVLGFFPAMYLATDFFRKLPRQDRTD